MAGAPAEIYQPDPEVAQLADTLCEQLWFGESNPMHTTAEAAQSLAASAARAVGLKPFPATAARLMQLFKSEDYRVDEVQRVLEADPGLATKLLNVANSAMFATSVACTSISQAVVRLGRRQVQDILAAVVTMELFKDAQGMGRDVLEHSVGVAAITRVLAKYWRFSEVDELFLAALLHDVGKLLSIETGEIRYQEMASVGLEQPDEVHLEERAQVGYDHAVLGSLVTHIWKIPEPVPSVISLHHQPGRAYQQGGSVGLMVALLRLADRFEYQIRSTDGELSDEFAEAIAKDGALQFADLKVEQVRNIWGLITEAHQDALASLPK